MRRNFLSIRAVVLVLALGSAAQPHDWGALGNAVTPTTSAGHSALTTLTSTASSLGMSPPAVGGSAGSTTVGGVPTFQFNASSSSPNTNYVGYTTWNAQDGAAIAFDVSQWTTGALTPPIDYFLLVEYVATAYHELAHTVYTPYFADWCSNNPSACSSFKTCIAGLTNPDGTSKGYGDFNNPCNEAYANGVEFDKLCNDKKAICQNPDLPAAEKAKLIAELDAAMKKAKEDCEAQSADCSACSGPPMPAGWPGCGSTCDCPP